MIEAIEFWNEPNNLSHWDFRLDPEWSCFSRMLADATRRSAVLAPGVRRVLGGICPIDPVFVSGLAARGALDDVEVVGVHGFPIDWDCWPIDEWPDRIAEVEAVTPLPVWVTEVGCSSMGADEVQRFGLSRTTQLLRDRVERTYWYSLLDLPRAWPPTIAAHEPAQGSNYHRHFHMGLIRDDGTPKPAVAAFDARIGVCQWFHWHDPRLPRAIGWLHRLGSPRLRTCISWADWHRPQRLRWFDRMMDAVWAFDTTLILCFTPPSRGIEPNASSPPRRGEEFAAFAEEIIRRYVRLEGWSPSVASRPREDAVCALEADPSR
ncbi:MAG: beta-xylosidase [Lautropia sp.]